MKSLDAARNKLSLQKAEKKDKNTDQVTQFGLHAADEEQEAEEDAERTETAKTETVEEFGAEGVFVERHAKLDKKLREITATTTKIDVNARREATIFLDNGQVWRQLASDNNTLTVTDKTGPYEVVIKRSAFGNYVATVAGIGRSIRVRRVK